MAKKKKQTTKEQIKQVNISIDKLIEKIDINITTEQMAQEIKEVMAQNGVMTQKMADYLNEQGNKGLLGGL